MNVLLLSARFPWPAFTGDRLRANVWLSALEHEANVALVAPAGRVPTDAPHFRFYPAARSTFRCAAGVLRVIGGDPLQTLLAAPFDWAGAIARARSDLGSFDASIVLLSRLGPCVRQHLPDGLHVLDAIDSLRRSMMERSRESSPWMRWFWRAESKRVGRVEESAVRAYDRVLVVSAEDAVELNAVVIPNGVRIAPLSGGPRSFDFGFWGRLGYFANRDAVEWLAGEIWPSIRAARPDARLLIAGADAPDAIRGMDGREGISVWSPVPDIAALARQIKIALVPLRYGTGQPSKILEAAEAGCAIVATSKAVRGLEPLAKLVSTSNDAAGITAAAIGVLSNETERGAMASALRRAVEIHYARRVSQDRLAAIVLRREAAA
ncbi:MAG TPA: glycosyltransferase [Thermoanaerobaculia bacterium]|nr:glycosyltransferase [Thermoanaerobaculia bacterium]